MTWAEQPLWRNAATCSGCGQQIEQGKTGWINPGAAAGKKVRCLTCGPGDGALRVDPVGGSSQLRMDNKRRGDSNLKGAVGEYLMGGYLEDELVDGARVLTDRKVPGDSEANIDHTVIAASGVWIIDSKKWAGEIRYRTRGLLSSDPNKRLIVDGTDRTSRIDTLYRLVIPVAQVIGNRAIPVHPVMAFIEPTWGVQEGLHFMRGKGPYKHDGVYLSGGRLIIKSINAVGPLSQEEIDSLYQKLDKAMPAR